MNPFQVEFEHYECMFWAESSRKKGARYDPRQLCDTFLVPSLCMSVIMSNVKYEMRLTPWCNTISD